MVVLALLVVLNEAIVLELGALLLALEGEVVPLGDLNIDDGQSEQRR